MKKKLFSVVMSLALVLGMISATSVFGGTTTPITSTTKADITINSAVEGDSFKAYKIVDISYDDDTQAVSHAINGDFAAYFTNAGKTIDDFAEITSDSDDLKAFLAGIPAYIAENNVSPVDTKTVPASGSAVFSNLAMGEYFIMPSATTSVYQLMLQKLEPAVEGDAYALADVVVNAKKSEVGLTKTVDKESVTKNEYATYTISVDIPVYPSYATKKNFSIKEVLDAGLVLDADSIKATFSDETTAIASDKYSLATSANGFTFTVDNAKYDDTWLAKAQATGTKLVITFKAKLDPSAASDGIIADYDSKLDANTTFTYSTYPYADETKTKTVKASVNSFVIKVVKVDGKDNTKKLAGAKFDLYRTLKTGEDDTDAVTIPNTLMKKGILLESGLTIDDNGVVEFKKYEASEGMYDYYLVETKAPVGYNLLLSSVKIGFTGAELEATDGIFTVTIENSTGFQLPITGDTGTLLMSAIGIFLMAGAVFLLVLNRKRKEN